VTTLEEWVKLAAEPKEKHEDETEEEQEEESKKKEEESKKKDKKSGERKRRGGLQPISCCGTYIYMHMHGVLCRYTHTTRFC
jgi:hypothetical protein